MLQNQQELLYMCIRMSAGFVTLSFLTDEDPGIGSKCLNQVTSILSYNFLASGVFDQYYTYDVCMPSYFHTLFIVIMHTL